MSAEKDVPGCVEPCWAFACPCTDPAPIPPAATEGER